jgi:hypothetical protein
MVRSRTYLMASSNAASAMPSEMLGFRQRWVLKALSSFLKPPWRSTTFSAGTSTLLNCSSPRNSPPIVW